MKFSSAIFVAASLAVVSAQQLGDIPTCAIECFIKALPASGCSTSDTECQCTTGREAIMNSIATCLPDKCSQADQQKTLTAGNALCIAAGITPSSGAPTPSPTGSSAPEASGSGSPTASAAPEQTSNAAVAQKAGLGIAALGFIAALGL